MKIMLICCGLASLLAAGVLDVPADTARLEPASNPSCSLGDPTYTGAKACKKCHFAWFKSWGKTKMAKAFDALKPGEAADIKKKFKLDPQKDYTKDAKCLACHTTGYGKPGGYPAVVEGKAWTDAETKRAPLLEGVQCEACHGPGSETGPYKKKNKDYKKADILKLGMVVPSDEGCKACHNDKSPTASKETTYDYEKNIKDAKILHKRKALKGKH